MIKFIAAGFLFFIPLVATSQSARKTNKLLQAEYTALLKTYDSLYRVDADLFSAGEQQYDELKKTKDRLFLTLREVSDLYRLWSLRTYELTSLEVLPPPPPFLEKKCKELDARIETAQKKLSNALKDHELDDRQEFPAVFPGKGSMKKQNQWLTESITEVRAKNKSLNTLNMQFRLVNATFEWSYSELSDVSHTLDSLKPVFEKELQFLGEKKEQAKANYAAKGPKGFNQRYAEIFWDVFQAKASVSEVSPEQVGDDHNGWRNEAAYPPVKAESAIEKDEGVHTYVDELAEFPGGMAALKEFIKANLKYPETAAELGIEGKCYLQFTVSDKGKISDVKVMRKVPDCPDCDREAVRMVQSMPNWIPGKISGKPVESTFNLPVKFELPQN